MAVQLTYTGTPFANQIRQQGFRPGGILSVAPGKIFSTTNPAFASTYGTPIKLATPKSAFSLPSFNFSSGVAGKEIIQSPKAATKGMRLAEMAERLKNVSPTAKNLLAGKTVSGFGGGVAAPGILRSLFSLPMAAVTAGPQVISSLMAPKTEAGFDYMKGFDEGAITSIADETAGLDFQDFGTGIMQADAAATQKAALENALIDAQMSSPRAMGAEDIGIPERRGILDFLKAGGAKVRDTLLQGAGATGGLNIGARLGMLVNPALGIPGALLGAFLGSKVTEMGPSGSFYEGLTDEQKDAVDEIYGAGGIMQGYNPVSMFGRGAAGAIDKRMGRIRRTLQKKQSDFLEKRLDELQAARDRITGTIRDASGRITGGTGQGTIDSGNEGGYGGTGGEGPSAVSSSGMLGGGV